MKKIGLQFILTSLRIFFIFRYVKVIARLSVSQKEPHYFDFNLKSWSWLALRPLYTTIISMHVKFSSWHRR